jgi:ubiquinone/menaquinone biosynthesis C-methylase UbiE
MIETARGDEFIGLDERFARRFRRRVRLDYRHVLRRTLLEASLKPGERVLDVTSHDASLALQMVGRVVPGQVVSVCPIEEILQQAYKQAQVAKLEEYIDWRIATLEELPFPDESFDAVTCGLSFRLLNTQGFVTEVYRLLAPGGRLVITEALIPPTRLTDWRLAARTFYYQYLTKNLAEAEADFYTADELADLLHETGFEPIVIRGLQKPLTRHSWVFSLIKAEK